MVDLAGGLNMLGITFEIVGFLLILPGFWGNIVSKTNRFDDLYIRPASDSSTSETSTPGVVLAKGFLKATISLVVIGLLLQLFSTALS